MEIKNRPLELTTHNSNGEKHFGELEIIGSTSLGARSAPHTKTERRVVGKISSIW